MKRRLLARVQLVLANLSDREQLLKRLELFEPDRNVNRTAQNKYTRNLSDFTLRMSDAVN